MHSRFCCTIPTLRYRSEQGSVCRGECGPYSSSVLPTEGGRALSLAIRGTWREASVSGMPDGSFVLDQKRSLRFYLLGGHMLWVFIGPFVFGDGSVDRQKACIVVTSNSSRLYSDLDNH